MFIYSLSHLVGEGMQKLKNGVCQWATKTQVKKQLVKKIYLFKKWGRGREREKILSRLHSQHGVQQEAPSHDLEITTWVETKNWTLSPLYLPGAPSHF